MSNYDDSCDRDDETNLSLLGKVQDYLRTALASQVPNSLLVAAWDEFYRVYNEVIRRYVVMCKVPSTEVDDCVQEVWVVVAKHLVKFKHPRRKPGLRAWIYQLVRSKSADVLRRRAKDPIHLARSGAPDYLIDDDSNTSIWHRVLIATLLDDIARIESKLTLRIFRMRMFEGYKAIEIAAEFGISPEVVRYRCKTILRELRSRLSVYTGDALDVRPGESFEL